MRRILLGIFAIMLIASCEPETYLFVDDTPISFKADGGSVTLNVVSNKPWSISSNGQWCVVSPSSGEGNTSGVPVTIKCEKNDSFGERSCLLTVYGEDGRKFITVSQIQNNALIVSEAEFSLGEEGGTITISIQSNISYSCEVIEGASWISEIQTRSLSSQSKQFSIKANDSYDEREGTIRIYNDNEGLSSDVRVRQSAMGAVIIEKNQYDLGFESQTISVEVLDNIDYVVTVDSYCQEWIQVVDTKGLRASSFLLQIAENEQKERVGVVNVTSAAGTIHLTIKQSDGTISFLNNYIKAYCIDNYDTNKDGLLSFREANEVKEICVDTYYITSLDGLSYFPNLERLLCYPFGEHAGERGQLTKLDVSSNAKLKMLDCENNQLESLDVSKNPDLERLSCDYNRLTKLDIRKNSLLTELTCGGNQLTSLDVSNHNALDYLYCSNNIYLSVLNVSGCINLRALSCWGNSLTAIDVSENYELSELYCAANYLTSLDVSKNMQLKKLSCSGNSYLTTIYMAYGQNIEDIDKPAHTTIQYK